MPAHHSWASATLIIPGSLAGSQGKGRVSDVMHLLLRIAAILFLIWVVMTLIGFVLNGLIHLLWIVILVALAIWLWQRVSGRRTTTLL